MDLLVAKIVIMLIFFFGALGSTFIPVILSRKRKSNSDERSRLERILEGCNSIAGGVFLATCFVALLPFVHKSYLKAIEAGGLDDHYPYGEITILVGFFLVVFVEAGITHHNASNAQKKAPTGEIAETSALMSVGSDLDSDANQRPSAHGQHHGQQHGGGGHSHNPVSTSRSLLHSIILVITLGVHTLFEGMAIGLLTDLDLLVALVIAVFIHEICCSIALGVNISQQSLTRAASLTICLVFSCMMPVGIAIGIGLGEVKGFPGLLLTAIMQGLATGTFMYVLFMEIVPSIFNSSNSLVQIILMFIGCVFMCLIIIFTHKHGHEESHEHEGDILLHNSLNATSSH